MPSKARGDLSDSTGKLVGGLDKSPVDDLADAAGYEPAYTPSSRSYGGSGSGGSGSDGSGAGDSGGGSGRHRSSLDDDTEDSTDSSGDGAGDDDADDDSEFSGEADTDDDSGDTDDPDDDSPDGEDSGDEGSDDTHGEHSEPDDDHRTGNDNDDDTSDRGRVSIDIQAMTTLIAAMERARDQIPEYEGELRKILSDVELIELRIPEYRGLASVTAWIEDELPGLRRRLALAQAIENGEFRIPTGHHPRGPRRPVTYEEHHVPDHQPHVSRERGQESAVLFTAESADPKADELIAKLKGNEHDPYFAHAFTSDADPGAAAEAVEAARQSDAAKAEELNRLLESTVQTAGRGTGELAPEDDFGDQWSQFAPDAPPAAAPA